MKSACERTTRYTPAVTIVAAWMRAETGCGARHCVRQPDEQRELGGFPGDGQEQQQGDGQQQLGGCPGSLLEDHIEIQAAKGGSHQENGQQHAKISHAVDDECLFGSFGVRGAFSSFFEPETDQQVGAQANPFPADEQHEKVVGAHQYHHRSDEEIKVNKIAAEAPRVPVVAHIGMHVTDGIKVDERANPCDHQHHPDREGIHAESPFQADVFKFRPDGQRSDHRFRVGFQTEREQDRHHESSQRSQDRDRADKSFLEPFTKKQVDPQPDEGNENHPGNQLRCFRNGHILLRSS